MKDYRELGYEAAASEAWDTSDDAWESEETHYHLEDDEQEAAACDFGLGWADWYAEQLTLVEAVGRIVSDCDAYLSSEEDLYIQGREIKPTALARFATEHPGRGWHLLEPVGYVAEDDIEEVLPLIEKLARRGLWEDQEAMSLLEDVVTPAEVAEHYKITHDAVLKAIKRNRILSRQSGKTHLMVREQVGWVWGKW